MGFNWIVLMTIVSTNFGYQDSARLEGWEGPDSFGYYWIDSSEEGGPTFQWIEISSSGFRVPIGSDQNYGLSLQTPFWFYGSSHNQLRICSNGWVSFSATGNGVPITFPADGYPLLISVLGTDLEPTISGPAGVYFQDTAGLYVIEWKNVPHLVNPSSSLTFEVILNPQDSTIVFQYLEAQGVNWNNIPRLIGIQNEDGSSYLSFSSPNFFRPISDSFAIRFYYNPVPDIAGLEILMPNASQLLEIGVPFTPEVQYTNFGPQNYTLRFLCRLDSLGIPFYEDTSQPVVLSVNDTVAVSFTSWTPLNHATFTMYVFPIGSTDPNPSNDTLRGTFRVPLPWDTVLRYYYGEPGGTFYSDQEGVFALRFTLQDSFRISYIRIGLVGEGDPFWPIPDQNRDPVVVGIWSADPSGAPGQILELDTLLRDTIPPGWIYMVPESTWVFSDSMFYVGIATHIRDYGSEAVLIDSSAGALDAQWMWIPGQGWIHTPWSLNGDPMLEVYGAYGPIDVFEENLPSTRLTLQWRGNSLVWSRPPGVPYELKVYNVAGQLIWETKRRGNESTLTFPKTWPTGLYFYQVFGLSEIYSGKGLIIRENLK